MIIRVFGISVCVVLAFFSLFLKIPIALASFSMIEDFDSSFSNASSWSQFQNGGTIDFNSGGLNLKRNSLMNTSFPFVRSEGDVFPTSGKFFFETTYKYENVGNFGDGINITKVMPNNGGNPPLSDALFQIWQDPVYRLTLVTMTCPSSNPTCDHSVYVILQTAVVDTNVHYLKIAYDDDGVYKVYLDSNTDPSFTSAPNQARPVGMWMGNPTSTATTDYWSSLWIDYVRISDDDPSATPTPTPTTTPTPLVPIIIIPGHQASWNFPEMLGLPGTNAWKIPSFIKVYDDLLSSLRNAGYVDNTD